MLHTSDKTCSTYVNKMKRLQNSLSTLRKSLYLFGETDGNLESRQPVSGLNPVLSQNEASSLLIENSGSTLPFSLSAMEFPPPTKEEIELVRSQFGLDEKRIKEAVDHLRDWLNLQPHLPHNCEDARLERWIIICRNNLEKAKSSIDTYYTMKNVMPDLLMDRDPHSEWFQKAISLGFAAPVPQLTDEGCRMVVVGLTDVNPGNITMEEVCKAGLMVMEVGLFEEYNTGLIAVVDFEHISAAHMTKFSLSLMKKMQVFFLKVINVKIQEICCVNTPPFVEFMFNVIKSEVESKIASRIHIYPKGALNLTDKFPPSLLPVEYGGVNGSVKELYEMSKRKVEKYRDWFLEQDKYRADESKRPGKPFDSEEMFGLDGSFRKLEVD